jgi:hypothetical protein
MLTAAADRTTYSTRCAVVCRYRMRPLILTIHPTEVTCCLVCCCWFVCDVVFIIYSVRTDLGPLDDVVIFSRPIVAETGHVQYFDIE